VSDLYAPMSGTVVEINQAILDHPEVINKDPYGEGWLLKIELSHEKESQSLLSPKAYQELLSKEGR
jgi:glycine cleavage system H protein